MAHVIADKADGPRGDSSRSVDFLRSYENLILLCADHHKIVDDDPGTYSVTELLSMKARHEAWVEELTGDTSGDSRVGISYIVVNGDSGLSELKNGRESEVFGTGGYNFHLVHGEPFTWALNLQELSHPWIGSPSLLDWEALRSLGAPIGSLRPGFPLKDELIRQGIAVDRVIRTEFAWVELGINNCPGIDPIEELASLDPRLGSTSSQWIADLRGWIMANVETRMEFEALHALLPVLQVREPFFYCLNIETAGYDGMHLHLLYCGRTVCSVVLDGRQVLVPLGCVFEDSSEEKWRICGTECGMLDKSGSLSTLELSTSLIYSDSDFLTGNIIGPKMLVDEFQIWDAAGSVVRQGRVRAPYNVREYVNCWFFGASCPEVFCRINGRGGWHYVGAALKGAIGPARSRAETVFVKDVNVGDRVEILILEVPGEVAYISVDVLFSGGSDDRQLLQRFSDVMLTPDDRIAFDFVSASLGRIYVHLFGYFERQPIVDAFQSSP